MLNDFRYVLRQLLRTVSQERLVETLSSFFGFFALLLGSVGPYGVMAYAVARRTREIGIRMASGAQLGRVARLVLGETLVAGRPDGGT